MINPKYDPNNYLKHLAVAVISDNQKINQLFGSYLLRVRWWHDNPKVLPQSDLIGTLRLHTNTPFGALEPRDYQFKISSHKQIYVQFLTIPIPEFEYKIEVIHPVGLTRSKIELWEYMPPETFNTSTNTSKMDYIGTQGSDPALLAATQANAVAIGSLATAMAAQPGLIADAIVNNGMVDTNYPNTLVGSTLMQLLSPDTTRQKAIITNWHTVEIKLWKSTAQLPNTLTYSSDGAFITLDAAKVTGGVLRQGGICTLDDNEAKNHVYAIANGASGAKGVAMTVTTTAS